ncbi:hypothetical protein L9F63_004046, partial [Diploptera punctata]
CCQTMFIMNSANPQWISDVSRGTKMFAMWKVICKKLYKCSQKKTKSNIWPAHLNLALLIHSI